MIKKILNFWAYRLMIDVPNPDSLNLILSMLCAKAQSRFHSDAISGA